MQRLGIILLAFLALLASCLTVQGQPLKPVGVFSANANTPGWMSFSHLRAGASEQEFWEAGQRCHQTGFRWLLYVEHQTVLAEDFVEDLVKIQDKARRMDVLPCIAGVMLGEEWYELFLAGHFAQYGLRTDSDLEIRDGISLVHDFMGRRQGEARTVLNLPIVWLSTLVNNDPSWGPKLWRPVPQHTDILAIDAYVPAGRSLFHTGRPSFALDVKPVLEHAINTTQLPIVIIPQWFRTLNGDQWREGPSAQDLIHYAEWHQHPRVIATMGFLWESRPEIVGLDALGFNLNWLGHVYGGVR